MCQLARTKRTCFSRLQGEALPRDHYHVLCLSQNSDLIHQLVRLYIESPLAVLVPQCLSLQVLGQLTTVLVQRSRCTSRWVPVILYTGVAVRTSSNVRIPYVRVGSI